MNLRIIFFYFVLFCSKTAFADFYDNKERTTSSNSDFEIAGSVLVKYHGTSSNVVIPGDLGITIIGQGAFSNNQYITSVVIPNGVTDIEQTAFTLCSNLVSLSIPQSVIFISSSVVQNSCNKFLSFDVDNANTHYSSFDGVLFNKDKTTILLYPPGKQGVYTIPGSVTRIEGWAFQGCSFLTSITISNSVTYIGEDAFSNATSLTSVDIPENVTYLGFASFYGCTKLTSVTIPSSVTSVGDNVFYNCASLSNVYVKWTTPLNVSNSTFTAVNLVTATLHVPAGTKALYQANPVWGTFGTIDDGIPAIENISESLQAIASAGGSASNSQLGCAYIFGQIVTPNAIQSEFAFYPAVIFPAGSIETGISEIRQNKWYCYAMDNQVLHLVLQGTLSNDLSCEIYNLQGVAYYKSNLKAQEHEIQINGYQTGAYIIAIREKNQIIETIKFIKR